MMNDRNLWSVGLLIAGVACAVDLLTKQLALSYLIHGVPIYVTPFFNLRLGFNEGVSFGMFAGFFADRSLALVGLMSLVAVLLLFWLWKTRSRLEAVALSLILGGALGNLVDRFRHARVTDFLDFHLGSYHWPTFNMADVFIVGGAIGIALLPFIEARQTKGGLESR